LSFYPDQIIVAFLCTSTLVFRQIITLAKDNTDMFNNLGLKIVLLFLITVSLTNKSFTQTNIKFAKGSSSATLKSSIAKNGDKRYTIRGKAGQTITVRVISGNNYVFAGVEGIGQGRTVSGKLQYDSSYIIELSNGGEATNFTMTVSIK
jgi:hypothetical protein